MTYRKDVGWHIGHERWLDLGQVCYGGTPQSSPSIPTDHRFLLVPMRTWKYCQTSNLLLSSPSSLSIQVCPHLQNRPLLLLHWVRWYLRSKATPPKILPDVFASLLSFFLSISSFSAFGRDWKKSLMNWRCFFLKCFFSVSDNLWGAMMSLNLISWGR